MNYELAKELKDAGFPFHHPDSKWSEYIFPTLSELIEACGEGFANLHRNSESGRFDSWEARDSEMNTVYGLTSEEAVARLWLALNKNNNEQAN